MKLPSAQQINDDVTFRPMYRHQQNLGISDEVMDGKVVSVRFTESKVFYDVYSDYYGKIFKNVDSIKVNGLRTVNTSYPKPATKKSAKKK